MIKVIKNSDKNIKHNEITIDGNKYDKEYIQLENNNNKAHSIVVIIPR